jgi:hypothetical protein
MRCNGRCSTQLLGFDPDELEEPGANDPTEITWCYKKLETVN